MSAEQLLGLRDPTSSFLYKLYFPMFNKKFLEDSFSFLFSEGSIEYEYPNRWSSSLSFTTDTSDLTSCQALSELQTSPLVAQRGPF